MKNYNSGSYNQNQKAIEFICTANQGRSVPAEIFANEYIERRAQSDPSYNNFRAISSGSGVNDIKAGNQSLGFMSKIVKKGIERGIYGQDTDYVRQLLDLSEDELEARKAEVKEYFHKVEEIFIEQEHRNREEAMTARGLESKIKDEMEQTSPRSDVVAVLPMAKRNLDAVKKIYENAGYSPEIMEVLAAYVSGNPEDEVPNAFGETDEVYHQMIEELKPMVEEAVEKVKEETEAQESLEEHLEDSAEEAEAAE